MAYYSQSYKYGFDCILIFLSYKDQIPSVLINSVSYLPQTYDISPIQPPQTKSIENVQENSFIIPIDPIIGEYQPNSHRVSQPDTSKHESKRKHHSKHKSDDLDDVAVIMNKRLIPPAPPYDGIDGYSPATREMGKKIYLKNIHTLYVSFFFLSFL